MSWDTECTLILRTMIQDDVAPYEFTDARLKALLVVSAFGVYQRIRGVNTTTYLIDVVGETISPDPAGSSLDDPQRDEPFENLFILKAACTLQKGAARLAAKGGFQLKDNDLYLDTRQSSSALVELLKSGQSFCAEYDEALDRYVIDHSSVAAAAVVGPYRTKAYGLDVRRPGDPVGRRYFG